MTEINPKLNRDFIDEIYEYRGRWDVPSRCGLKIVAGTRGTVIIASELYDDNPGTSVNNWNCQLADQLCRERSVDPDRLIFIEHNPDKGSKLENYRETFDRVIFTRSGDRFADPDWEPLTRQEVVKLLEDC
jgi:hypothetical protein